MLSRLRGAATPALPDLPAPPFPADATMFFCIGAQKAGTTWLYDYLSRSPDVHFSPNKELHYFDVRAGRADLVMDLRLDILRKQAEILALKDGRLQPNHIQRLRESVELLGIYTGQGEGARRHQPYLRYLLRGRKEQKAVGDITPAYAVLDRATYADMATIGQAKFLFILRDPVARMWSQIRMAASIELGEGAAPGALAEACTARARLLIENRNRLPRLERADYLRTMEELEAAVPAERILYVFYEDLFGGGGTEEICRFLGIAPLPADGGSKVNEGSRVELPDDIRATFREAFDRQYQGLSRRFGDRLPERWQV